MSNNDFFSAVSKAIATMAAAQSQSLSHLKPVQEESKPIQPKSEPKKSAPKKSAPKKSAPTHHWYKQKSEEVENHLKHIALMKLQLTKNLKYLQSPNGGHLWIDTDFIDPATETLQASLEQVQDLEDRLYLLNLTYQDHL